ncbi:cysteine hydrolase family protein [Neomoorella thermoacetica]|uniref:Isochorismatase hydrolase n=1 Tax=Moorella thermoacetica (strain ATCC 39073 / JCM 9320) TaxID=264732 RepID=Q2RLV6_MOOTA|nr:isochorismatase family cysteine hydrolase [Moorella thermoacetica]AKX93080.1 N-carbamoylsarcosine amidase [Moorella thermoacetica]AKX95630.1 N-carbamoylsarcosine amidase [Moorella thermoacetica]OIQ53359.1 peroxyureidoacrylate/ureidoacrylate amidohydrolase RutB [Moorella thermoacetica]OIQ53462.1 peroxyureidoacrylate/ureidoacrylate amidohydrolase RutB [Moorella thermoacetica]QCZ99439.1 nicotinamidase/pyrazinamidase [Moorella thermoacetica]
MRHILFVIDMQNDFVAEGGALSFPAAREIIPFVSSKVKQALSRGMEVLLTLDTHIPGDAEFQKFPPHCLEGTPGQALIPELQAIIAPYEGTGQIKFCKKNRYSAFYNTDLDAWLGLTPGSPGERVSQVEMVGVCTNICCFFTAEELANRDIPVRILAQGMASFDPGAHRWALDQIRRVLGLQVAE